MNIQKKIEITRIVSKFYADEVFELPENNSKAVFDSELRDIMRFYSLKGEAFRVYKNIKRYPSAFDKDTWRKNFQSEILFNLVKEEGNDSFKLNYDLAYVRMVYMYAYGDEELIRLFFTFDKKYEEAYNFIVIPESFDLSSKIAKEIASISIE